MAFEFNPTTGKLDSIADPGGANTQIQFNDNGEFGGDADLTYNKATNKLTSGGDVELNDGGFTTTTLQVVSAIDATFTARIDNGTPGNAGTTMTLTSAATGTFALGQKISGTGVTAGTTIVSLASGSLGANASTYVVSVSQSVAATAFQSGTDKVISLPNRTGTVGLVAGSTTQIIQNLNGAYAGVSTLTADSNGNITLAGRLTNTYTSLTGAPAKTFTGSWFAGATPHFLIQPTGATTPTSSNAWSANGTALAINSLTGFTGNLLDFQVNGTRQAYLDYTGVLFARNTLISGIRVYGGGPTGSYFYESSGMNFNSGADSRPYVFERCNISLTTSATNPTIRFGGTTSSFPSLKRDSTALNVRLADDSANAPLTSAAFTASGDISRTGANGQATAIRQLTELTTVAAAATTDTTIQIPAGAIVLGVTVRVTTVIPTATTFDVGIAGSTTKFGTGISTAATTTNVGSITPELNASAVSVRFTPNSTPVDNTGRIGVTIHYMQLTAATS